VPDNRQQRRKKLKILKKQLKSRMDKVREVMSQLPETCIRCDETFTKEGKKCLDWKINVSPSKGIFVTCPDCLKKQSNQS